jgi:hypothetical protein
MRGYHGLPATAGHESRDRGKQVRAGHDSRTRLKTVVACDGFEQRHRLDETSLLMKFLST